MMAEFKNTHGLPPEYAIKVNTVLGSPTSCICPHLAHSHPISTLGTSGTCQQDMLDEMLPLVEKQV